MTTAITTHNDALAALNASLAPGGARNAFAGTAEVGDQVSGTITDVEQRHRTERDTGRPLYWLHNHPQAEQVTSRPVTDSVITLHTEVQLDDDEGLRRVWVNQGVRTALREALGRAGVAGLEIGGRIEGLMYVGVDERNRRIYSCERYVDAESARPRHGGTDSAAGDQPPF